MMHWRRCASGCWPAAPSATTPRTRAKGKLFARERIALLVDEGSFVEDGLFANALADGLPADGVITGTARIDGRAGLPDGQRLHGQGRLLGRPHGREDHPDHRAGLRDRRADGLPGRLGRRPHHRPGRPVPRPPRRREDLPHPGPGVRRRIPQVCALFGPSAAGGAYIPAFCDVVAMVEGNASMYLGSDRMVEMVTGEKTTLEAMGGARVHCAESGVGHFLCKTEADALDVVRRYLSYLPSNWTPAAARGRAAPSRPRGPRRAGAGQRAAGVRHAPVSSRASSTRARSSRSRRCGPAS